MTFDEVLRLLILLGSNISFVLSLFSEIGPEVLLSNATFYTSHEFINTSNSTHFSYLIPITFKALEFNCTSVYPNTWKFANPPYSDTRLKDISITKTRQVGIFTDPSSYKYQSTIRLNFKHATSVPQIFCRGSRKNKELDKERMVTAVNSVTTDDEFRIRIVIIRKNASHEIKHSVLTRVGNNKNCRVTLNISLDDKTFACGSKGLGRVRPQIIHCNNPDECNSIFVNDDYHCGNSTWSKQCHSKNKNKCLQFFPSTSPGVIICYDNAFNDSIARRYLITQTPKGLHFHLGSDSDFENETIFLTSNQKMKMFDGQHVTFVCNGTGSYYTHGFQWAIIDENGTTYYLGTGREKYLEQLQIYNVTKAIYLNRKLYGGDVNIICFGPRWNLIKWVNATMAIEIKVPLKPIILNESYAECSDETWIPQNNSHFTCKTRSLPLAQFRWFLELEGRKSELKSRGLGSLGLTNSTEGFHYVNTTHSKDITETKLTIYFKLPERHNVSCVATNYIGSDSKSFSCRIALVESNWHWNRWMISALTVVTIALVLILIGAVYFIKRTRRKLQLLSDEEIEEFEKGNPTAENALLLPYNMEFEIPREQILIENMILGEGQFGLVLIGKLLRTGTGGVLGSQQVAIKTYKKSADVGYLKALLSEIKIMSQIEKHPNLVNLIGASTRNLRKREVLVLIEYCPNGNLMKYLRMSRGSFLDYFNLSNDAKARQIRMMERGLTEQEMTVRFTTTQNLLMWAYESANAMEYLSSKKVVHCDLAARNILLTETLHAKVGDFGLSKQLFEYSIYVQTLNCPLPLKWLALETLQDLEFSLHSDIWSYGIVLWEIFSLGQSPYPGIPQWNFQSYNLLLTGYRMEKPEFANQDIYKMMLACWNSNPESRPSFTKLKAFFHRELYAINSSPSIEGS